QRRRRDGPSLNTVRHAEADSFLLSRLSGNLHFPSVAIAGDLKQLAIVRARRFTITDSLGRARRAVQGIEQSGLGFEHPTIRIQSRARVLLLKQQVTQHFARTWY